ncbi:MAG: MBL fold metallo-hydrolase [Candidatus Spyradosoma sp.]
MQITDLNSGKDIGANCLLAEIGPFRILLDCGLHPKKLGRDALPQLGLIRDLSVDFVILSHCHLDHLGGLPVLLREHPGTRVLCSPASRLVATRILRNSVNVMMRQREEQHVNEYPLYTFSELDAVDAALTALPLGVPKTFHENDDEITFTLYPAGHVAGAVGCMIEYRHRKIFYTGDVSFHAQETVEGAAFPQEKIDTLILETTRGANEPEDATRAQEVERLVNDVAGTLSGGGSVLVPAFAFGRMQELAHIFLAAKNSGRIPKETPVFCTGLGLDLADYFELMARKTGDVNFHRSLMKDLGVQPLRTWEEPGIDVPVQGIYLLSSGMLVERTPAWHIAANMLGHAHNLVAFVGYCDPDTPGGRLLTRTNVDELRFADMNFIARVLATVSKYDLSGHTTRERMMDFVFSVEPRVAVLTHGDPEAREWFEEEFAIELPKTKTVNLAPGVAEEI